MSRPRTFTCLALLALLVLPAPAARATQMLHLDTQALVTGSNDIVIGRVEAVRPHWNATRTKIFTDISVRVSQTLKGAPGERITITQLGGEVDGVRYTIPGCATFTPGEEALLFVWRDRTGQGRVNALGQGKFDIRRDPATGEATVQRSVPGLAVGDARRLKLTGEGETPPRIPLGDLVQEIQRVLATEGGR